MRGWIVVTAVMSFFGIALLSSLGVNAPPARQTYRTGLLIPALSSAPPAATIQALFQRIEQLASTEGRNLIAGRRFSGEQPERLPALAADFAQAKADLNVAVNTPAALAAKQTTQTIPVVMVSVGDPVGTGLVSGLGRPGINLTGVSGMATDLSAKEIRRAGKVLGATVEPWGVQRLGEIDVAFASISAMLPNRRTCQSSNPRRWSWS
jgi:ABC transporter substrate binding protein